MLVGGLIIIELKAVEAIIAVHQAQLLSYLKHSNKRLGLLINFNSVLFECPFYPLAYRFISIDNQYFLR